MVAPIHRQSTPIFQGSVQIPKDLLQKVAHVALGILGAATICMLLSPPESMILACVVILVSIATAFPSHPEPNIPSPPSLWQRHIYRPLPPRSLPEPNIPSSPSLWRKYIYRPSPPQEEHKAVVARIQQRPREIVGERSHHSFHAHPEREKVGDRN